MQDMESRRLRKAVEILGAPAVARERLRGRQVLGTYAGFKLEFIALGDWSVVVLHFPAALIDLELRIVRGGDQADDGTLVPSGDVLFDAELEVAGAPRDIVMELLDAPVRRWLLEHRVTHFELRDGRYLRLQIAALEPEAVREAIDLVVQFAEALEPARTRARRAREVLVDEGFRGHVDTGRADDRARRELEHFRRSEARRHRSTGRQLLASAVIWLGLIVTAALNGEWQIALIMVPLWLPMCLVLMILLEGVVALVHQPTRLGPEVVDE